MVKTGGTSRPIVPNQQTREVHRMPDDVPSDEQRLYAAFQQVINVLLPLEKDLRERVYATVGTFFSYAAPEVGLTNTSAGRPAGERSPPDVSIAPHEPPSPKDFLFQKQPNTDIERVACLAYYLAHYRSKRHFKTADISKLNTEAAQNAFANASRTVSNATQAGFLAPVSRGMKQLSAPGERYVDQLPDQAAAKAVMQRRKPRRTRRPSTAESAAGMREQAE